MIGRGKRQKTIACATCTCRYNRRVRFISFLFAATSVLAGNYPAPTESDFVIHNYQFNSGEKLADLKLHYTTIGTLKGNNAVLIMHGTGGTGRAFLSEQ